MERKNQYTNRNGVIKMETRMDNWNQEDGLPKYCIAAKPGYHWTNVYNYDGSVKYIIIGKRTGARCEYLWTIDSRSSLYEAKRRGYVY